MRKLNTLLATAFMVVLATGLSAQPVSFTNMSGELNPISGSSYEDCAVDMNGDYLDDVVRVTSLGIYIDYQQAGGGFTQTFHEMLVQNPPTWSICAGDIDADGYNDLLFGNGSRVSFVYANDNGSSYSEDPHPEYIFSQRSTFADIDNDGNLDAFVCHDVDLSHPYRNDGNGNLTLDQSLIQTIDAGGNYAAVWCDYDNDGDNDLYITKCRGGAPWGDPQRINGLYQNNGNGTFSEVGIAANMDDGNQSWTTIFEDFDNDGWFEAFTVNHASGDVPGGARNKLMENNQDGTFTDIIDGSGIDITDLGAWNCDAGDFNNDGFVDIFSELSDELYLNNGDGTFTGQDLSFDDGGIGDFNGDGFLDVINGNSLWINDGNNNNYVIFSLDGIFSNKNGIGSRIEIHGDWGIQVREVRAGTSFSPMKSLNAHFGLGDATSIDSVVVRWPSGVITTIEDPAINTEHVIPEAECILATTPIEVTGSTTICTGESVTLTAEDGFDSYTWSNGAQTQTIEVAEAGTYTATLTDDEGCVSVSEQVVIDVVTEEEDVITLSADGETQFCEGEMVTISASNGSEFSWSNGEETQMIEVTESGDYFVTAMGACSEVTSDTITVNVLPAPAPIVQDVELTEPGTALLEATGEGILWYDDEMATEPIGSGNTWETPELTGFTVYWAEANSTYGGQLESGGKPDNTGGGGLPSTGAYSYFNAFEPFTILDVRVYVPVEAGAGVRDVQLFDGSNNMLASASFNLEVGEQVITLDFDVPAGEGLSLRCPQNNMYRNSSGVQYPYAIGTVGEIYDSFYGGSYYYYFYDWNVQKEQQICPSVRVPVAIGFTGVSDDLDGATLQVFPNPASDWVNIELQSAVDRVWDFELFSVAGQLVWSNASVQATGQYFDQIDTRALPAGVYYLRVHSEGASATHKIVLH